MVGRPHARTLRAEHPLQRRPRHHTIRFAFHEIIEHGTQQHPCCSSKKKLPPFVEEHVMMKSTTLESLTLQGTNNKIKTMQRQAYGFRDLEFFKLKILAIHRSRYALVG